MVKRRYDSSRTKTKGIYNQTGKKRRQNKDILSVDLFYFISINAKQNIDPIFGYYVI